MNTTPLRTFATFASLRFTLLFLFSTLSAHATRDLLVANPATNSILRFDGQSGAPKGNFVATGAGGLISPRQMQQGPDGALYVADFDRNNIKKYGAEDGNYINDFLAVNSIYCPTAFEFSSNNQLYVAGRPGSCGTTRAVNKYNSNDGGFILTFISASASRLGIPRDFLFLNNGNLLFVGAIVAGPQFDGTTGAYVNFWRC